MLMEKTGIDKKQLKNWFTNARRRIWKPMLKKQIEQGKLTAAPGIPGGMPGLMLPMTGGGVSGTMDNPHSVQAMRAHYQQAVQQRQQSQEEAAAAQQVCLYLFSLVCKAFEGSTCIVCKHTISQPVGCSCPQISAKPTRLVW
jgi:hypothetical protein